MEQISSIHLALKNRDKKVNWPYMSSIMVKNRNVPLFETHFGQLDYSWLLEVTKNRICVETKPQVVRWVSGENLSLDPLYRSRDFYISLLLMDGDLKTMKKMFGSHGRYYYVIGDMKMARFFLYRSNKHWKIILYILTSYSKILSKLIIKKYGVFG